MFSRTNISTIFSGDGDDIIVAIVTNNLSKLRNLLTRSNVNKIIDSKNKYTALHYAVTLPNNDITQFILELGADPKIRQDEGYDAYELSLRSGKKYIFEYFKEKQQKQITNLETENKDLNRKVVRLEDVNNHLNDSIDAYNKKVLTLNKLVEQKTNECNKLKRDLDDSEQAFSNLLKKQRKN